MAKPQPVQVLFQFETKGAPNARATKMLKTQVFQIIKDSGAFSDIGETPTPNGAVLSVTIDNVMDPGATGDAEAKGFVTGATFFLVGNTVKDNYICTVSYVAGPGASTITKTARHALYTQVGMTAPTPKDAVKVGAIKEALNIMVRQIVANPLNECGARPGLPGRAGAGLEAVAPPPIAAPTAAAAVIIGVALVGKRRHVQPARTAPPRTRVASRAKLVRGCNSASSPWRLPRPAWRAAPCRPWRRPRPASSISRPSVAPTSRR